MHIEERAVGNVVILDLKGKITLGEGDEALRDRINQLIQKDQKRILLNLADVPYIDSAGLGEIVRTYTTVKNRGGQLKLVNLTSPGDAFSPGSSISCGCLARFAGLLCCGCGVAAARGASDCVQRRLSVACASARQWRPSGQRRHP